MLLMILLNVIHKPVKVYRYVRTVVSVYTSYIFYLCWNYEYTCWRWQLLHFLSVNFKSKL